MANEVGSALGGVGSGAAAGSAFGPIGAGVGALIGLGGSIFGMTQGSPQYNGGSYSDISLENENPELYRELLKVRFAADQAEQMYNARRQGPTDLESRQFAQDRAHAQQQMANQGLLGTSAGIAGLADTDARLRGAIADRAFKEQQALAQNAMAARMQETQMTAQAQNAIMASKQHSGDQSFNSANAEDAARNQFFSGLMNSGAGAYQAYQNQNMLSNMQNNQQSYQSTPYIPQSNYSAPSFGQGYSLGGVP